ncbi:Glyoxylase, beta-lactamase superfamily II [Hathewaya proteolytica DSM 3090]|uniref:Glyoxylase, beta-lactamase superfamily II n=1 Tax=Hathewaya proteolytica DSM 3090 TaxID=1121331 RepID=A0A1M6P7S6_9CLOT|nr:MBL fold metallo-hydrolase [Hathewaya proteolytica]SHK04031.1 Glyoxylase, beta-lactamase superfamily II [Hathewaya proteolytica DSM 3090]
MIIKRVVAGIYAANCYIIMDEDTNEGVVLDPGGDVDDILKEIEKMGVKVKYIFLTHGHLDHTSGVELLRNSLNEAPLIGISQEDSELINQGAHLYGPLLEGKEPDIYIKHGDVYKFGNKEIKCVSTPGHTPGGISFIVDNNIFTGDTLFYMSMGRTDLTGGSNEVMMNTLKNVIKPMPDELIVYPGHSRQSTLEYEKKNNPYLKTL